MATVEVLIPLDDPTGALETYLTIRLYRDSSRSGSFGTLVDSATIVATQHLYTIEDPAGNGFWRFKLYNATTLAESALSPVIEAAGTTLAALRLAGARAAGGAMSGTATTGTTTTFTDPRLAEYGVDEHYLEGGWVYRPDAADEDDRVRRIALDGYDVDTFTLTVTTAYANSMSNGEVYHVFMLLPPTEGDGRAAYSWDEAVRDGLDRVVFEDQLNLGAGDGVADRFDMSAHASYVGDMQIRKVITREIDVNGIYHEWRYGQGDTWWEPTHDGIGTFGIALFGRIPTEDEDVIVYVNRKDAQLFIDTDLTRCPRNRAVTAVAWAALDKINRILQPGRYAQELAGIAQQFNEQERYERPLPVVRGL